MAVNRGVAPLDPTTDVGKVRLRLQDTEYVALVPPEAGYGDYAIFSDEAIEGFIDAASGDLNYGTGYGYLALAAIAASSGGLIQTDDLRFDNSKRASEFRAIAGDWFGRGDIAAQGADIFELAGGSPGCCNAELSEWPCRCNSWV